MANEAQRTRRGARRRRKLLSGLVLASGCINLAALCCMMLFMCAGLYYSSWDTQALGYFDHPGDDNIAYREFAMVQFETSMSEATPTVYWFLNSCGWAFFYEPEIDSADLMYRGAGQTFSFPEIIHELFLSLNYTMGNEVWNNCTYYNHTLPSGLDYICEWDYNNATVKAFDSAPPLSLPTAPAFIFYVIAIALTFVLAPVEMMRCTCGPGSASHADGHPISQKWDERLLWTYAVVVGAHLLGAATVTGLAVRARNYLGSTPELAGVVWGVALGDNFLKIIWFGFLATALACLMRFARWSLKRRWRATLEWEEVVALAEIQSEEDRRRRRAAASRAARAARTGAGVERQASEHASIRTPLPEYEETPKEAPTYEESAENAAEGSAART